MTLRWQLPVYSPIDVAALVAGVRAALTREGGARDAIGQQLRVTFGARDLVLTDSGTSALTAALIAVGARGTRLRVALPAYTCYDVATAADGAKAEVVLYDVDPRTLGPDMASLRDALARGVTAVVVAHLYGIPVEVAPLRELCAASGASLIEDGAQTAGAELAGMPVGAGAPLLILSFGRGKGVTAGSGGAVLGGDACGAEVVERIRATLPTARGGGEMVQLAAQWLLGRPGAYGIPARLPFLHLGETRYRRPLPSRAMSRAAAGVLSRSLASAGREVIARRRHAERLLEGLGDGGALVGVNAPRDARPGYLRLPLVASATARRLAESRPARRLGIMPGYPLPLAKLPGFGSRCVNAALEFPGATELAERLITLPTHSLLSPADLRALRCWMAGAVAA